MDQISYVIRQLDYNIYLVYEFQHAIMIECKVIRKQTTDNDLHSVIFDNISRLTWTCFHDGPNSMWSVNYTIILPCVQISTCYNHDGFQPAIMSAKLFGNKLPIRTQIRSFLTILNSIPRLT